MNNNNPRFLPFLRCAMALVAALVLSVGCRATVPEIVANAPSAPGVSISPDFVVGAGDILDVAVYGHSDLSLKILVPPSGVITYPFVGDLPVTGRHLPEIRDAIREGLADGFIPDPRVAVNVSDISSQKVHVLGEVRSPGVQVLQGETHVIEAISGAGGFTRDSDRSRLLLVRRGVDGKNVLDALNMERFLEESDPAQNPPLQRGDILYVPPSGIANVERAALRLNSILTPFKMTLETIILLPRAENVLTDWDSASGSNVQIE